MHAGDGNTELPTRRVGGIKAAGKIPGQGGESTERPITDADREWLEGIYRDYPRLKRAFGVGTLKRFFGQSTWSDEAIKDLLLKVATAAEEEDDIHQAYESLSEAIEAGVKAGWSVGQQRHLLLLLAEETPGKMTISNTYSNFAKALLTLKQSGFSIEWQFDLLRSLVEASGSFVDFSYLHLAKVLRILSEKNWDTKRKFEFLVQLIHKSKASIDGVLFIIETFLYLNVPDEKFEQAIDKLVQWLDYLADDNRERVLGLLASYDTLLNRFGKAHFYPHFDLYVTLFERWPKLGYALLEGILEGEREGIIPADLTPELRRGILDFIGKTKVFAPAVYKAYCKEGDVLLAKINELAGRILTDPLSADEVNKIIQESKAYGGIEFLWVAIQTASSTSDAILIDRSSQLLVLRRLLETRELKGHLLVVWQVGLKKFELEVKQLGEELDDLMTRMGKKTLN